MSGGVKPTSAAPERSPGKTLENKSRYQGQIRVPLDKVEGVVKGKVFPSGFSASVFPPGRTGLRSRIRDHAFISFGGAPKTSPPTIDSVKSATMIFPADIHRHRQVCVKVVSAFCFPLLHRPPLHGWMRERPINPA